jgi:hypothetical protein
MISRIFLAVLLTAGVVAISMVAPGVWADEQVTTNEKTVSSEPAEVIKRGNKIGKSPVVSLADIVEAPEKYENKKIILEGTIKAVCQKKGCWMEMAPADGETGVRVTFKDYGFFVPKDAAGLKVRAEGKIKLTELSKEDVKHLQEDGAHICKNSDGTASEIGFVAYGVELYRTK